MKSSALLILGAILVAASTPADAKECQIKVIRAVTDDLGNLWKPGKVLPVDIERNGPNGGAFCAHGGSCIPRRVGSAKAVRLVNCVIGPTIGEGDRRLTPSRF